MSSQDENSKNTMSLEEEWIQEEEQEKEEKEDIKIKIEIIKEDDTKEDDTKEDNTNNMMTIEPDNNMIDDNDKNLYYSRENPGYTIVKLPGLYPYKVSKPINKHGLRRMTTTWSIDDNDTVIDYDYFDDVKEDSLSLLQSLISTKNLENEM